MSSPISSWEGASSIFTFADKPTVLAVIMLVAVTVTVVAIWVTIRHEKHSYNSPMTKK
ncbi:MAG: hypothetical protein Q7J46_11975 [Pseudomonas sp.]|nr:hypothetical protein [Pseudomonas sp.]